MEVSGLREDINIEQDAGKVNLRTEALQARTASKPT